MLTPEEYNVEMTRLINTLPNREGNIERSRTYYDKLKYWSKDELSGVVTELLLSNADRFPKIGQMYDLKKTFSPTTTGLVEEQKVQDKYIHVFCEGCNQTFLVDKSFPDDGMIRCGNCHLFGVNTPKYTVGLLRKMDAKARQAGGIQIFINRPEEVKNVAKLLSPQTEN